MCSKSCAQMNKPPKETPSDESNLLALPDSILKGAFYFTLARCCPNTNTGFTTELTDLDTNPNTSSAHGF